MTDVPAKMPRQLLRLTDKYTVGLIVYAGVSVVSALFEWLTFFLALAIVNPFASSLAGFVSATGLNFVLCHLFVFRSSRTWLRELCLVVVMSGAAFGANFLVFVYLYTVADITVAYAKIIGTCSGFVFNYAIRQFYIFSRVSRFPAVSRIFNRNTAVNAAAAPDARNQAGML
jgi:putative flippase GtrA